MFFFLPDNLATEKMTKRKNKIVVPPSSTLFPIEEDEKGSSKNDDEKKLLQFEIESWRPFAKALRLEDRQLLNRMMEKIWPLESAVESAKEGYETEAFLLALLILQQKTIDRLEEMLTEKKKRRQRDE